MSNESDQEELAPLPRSKYDMVPKEISDIFDDILKWRVDPWNYYYGVTIDHIVQKLHDLNNGAVAAIDSEFRYTEKGHMYDPIMQSFIQGSGGRISTWSKEENNLTPVVLRGITKRKQMDACRAAGRNFYYIDTGYFGNGKKKTYHRVTLNDVQNFGPIIERPADRVEKCNITISKFRKDGSKILLAPPSQKLLNLYDIDLEQWMQQTIAELKQHTDREIVIRLKQGRSVRQSTDTMQMALEQDIWCLVTYSSIAAGEALLCGKPAITLGPNAAGMLCSNSLSEIENPFVPTTDQVEAWARHIAYCQFTEPEMRDGTAWRILNDH
jgi:hypothetical protein